MATSALLQVTPEAAARIAQIGLQSEIDRMLDYARQNLSELTHIEVNLYDRYEMGEEPGLAIEAYCSLSSDNYFSLSCCLIGKCYRAELPKPLHFRDHASPS